MTLWPRVLAVEITARCNTDCAMCARQFWGPDIPRGDMSWETFTRCVDTKGLEMVCLGQYGEPLLWPDFIAAIKYCKDRGLYVWTTTNGALLDRQTVADATKAGIDKIIISMDAIDAGTYAKIRPGLNFDQVVANARRTIDFAGVEVVVNATRVPEVKNTDDEIRKFWDTWVDGVALTPEADVSPVPGTETGPPITCERPAEHLTVRADGEVVLCCRDAHMFWRFGNVNDHDLLEIFNSPQFNAVRDAIASGVACPAMCRGCRVHWPDARKPVRNADR